MRRAAGEALGALRLATLVVIEAVINWQEQVKERLIKEVRAVTRGGYTRLHAATCGYIRLRDTCRYRALSTVGAGGGEGGAQPAAQETAAGGGEALA